jgi:hypothetical protein
MQAPQAGPHGRGQVPRGHGGGSRGQHESQSVIDIGEKVRRGSFGKDSLYDVLYL